MKVLRRIFCIPPLYFSTEWERRAAVEAIVKFNRAARYAFGTRER